MSGGAEVTSVTKSGIQNDMSEPFTIPASNVPTGPGFFLKICYAGTGQCWKSGGIMFLPCPLLLAPILPSHARLYLFAKPKMALGMVEIFCWVFTHSV